MNRTSKLGLFCSAALLATNVLAQATVGQPAPAFKGVDAAGKPVDLADFKGKYVVLEWTNPDCPFVRKHYDSGNMPATQKAAVGKGVAWVSIQTGIDDTPKGRADLAAWQGAKQAVPTATVIDADGQIGRTYRAATTPQIFILDPQGKVIYTGGIDSKATANPADIASATNYVNQALGEALAGKPVSQPVTKPYGCSVKYPSKA